MTLNSDLDKHKDKITRLVKEEGFSVAAAASQALGFTPGGKTHLYAWARENGIPVLAGAARSKAASKTRALARAQMTECVIDTKMWELALKAQDLWAGDKNISLRQMSKMLGISETYLSISKRILKYASDGVLTDLDAGRISLFTAYERTKGARRVKRESYRLSQLEPAAQPKTETKTEPKTEKTPVPQIGFTGVITLGGLSFVVSGYPCENGGLDLQALQKALQPKVEQMKEEISDEQKICLDWAAKNFGAK